VGDDVLWSRPGAVPAFEREPGAVDEEPGGVACECVVFACGLVVVVVVVVVLEVGGAVLDGVLVAAGVWAVACDPPPLGVVLRVLPPGREAGA
jgi:hypothetical protein